MSQPRRKNTLNSEGSQENFTLHDLELSKSLYLDPIQEEGGLNFSGLLASVRRRWVLVTAITITVSSITFFGSVTRAPVYRGQFKILAEPVTAESEVVAAVTGETSTIIDQDLGETQASKVLLDYETQFQVLLSRKLLEPVANKLETQFPQLNYNKLQRSIKISRLSDQSKIIQVAYQSTSPMEVENLLNTVSQAYMNYSLQERQSNLKRAIEFANNQLPTLKIKVFQLEQQLQEFRERNLVTDPEVYGLQLTEQLGSFQTQLEDIRIQSLQKKSLLRSLQTQTQLDSNNAEAGSVLSEAPEYRKLLSELQKIETQIALQSETQTPNHPAVIELIGQRDRLIPLVQKAAETTVGSRLYNKLEDPENLPFQNALRQNLVQQLVNTELEIQSLQAEEQGIRTVLTEIQRKLFALPAISRKYESLQRQLQLATENRQNFLKTRSTLLLNSARQEVPWELIEAPTIQKIAFSSLPRDLSLGMLLGLLLGCGIAILLDKVNRVVHTVDELRSLIKVPILGWIPMNPELEDIKYPMGSKLHIDEAIDPATPNREKISLDFNNPFVESFRSLNVKIRMLQVENPIRSLVISSCLPNEGKSTISIHLAEAAAEMGQRVLLVDADLRAPQIHHRLMLQKMPGLIEILTLEMSFWSAVKPVPAVKNLSVLTSGSMLTEQGLYLGSSKMQDLMSELEKHFDLVIYDTPPLGLSDSMLISPYTDGLLIVTKLGTIDDASLQETFLRLQGTQTNLIGVIANCVKQDQQNQSLKQYYKNQQVVSQKTKR